MPITTYALDLSGVSGNYTSTPDRATFTPSGVLEVTVEVSPRDVTPGSPMTLASQWADAGNQRSWLWWLTESGFLRLYYSRNGIEFPNSDSTIPVPISDNQKVFLRFRRDPILGVTIYHYSFDGVSFTPLGLPVVGLAGELFNSTTPIAIGAYNTGTTSMFSGLVHSAKVSMADVVVANPFFDRPPTSSFVDLQGNTWSIFGAGTTIIDERNTVAEDFEFSYNNFLIGGKSVYGLMEVAGLDTPDSRESIIEKAEDHGAYVDAELLDPRRITITGDAEGSASEVTMLMNEWKKAYVPRRDVLPLVFKLPGDQIKVVYCVPVKRSFKIDREYALDYGKWAIQFLAGDPKIYSMLERLGTVTSSSTGPTGADFDVDFPIIFGGGTSGSVAARNEGIFPTAPFIRIDGPAVNPVIRHVEQNKLIEIEGTIDAGRYLELDFAEKTAMLDGASSVYSAIDHEVSEWFTIEPGDNTINFNAQNASPSTLMTIKWRDTWI